MSLLRNFPSRPNTSRILKLLQKQRAAALSGKLDDLGAQSKALELLLQDLEKYTEKPDQKPDSNFMSHLGQCSDLAKSNLALLAAGQNGVKAARLQLVAISSAQNQLSTYSGSGQKRDLISAPNRLEKRS